MSRTETLPWDPADYLKTDQDVAHYLNAAFEDGDPALIAAALADVARARGLAKVAVEAGLEKETPHGSLASERIPEFAMVLKVTRALGLKLKAAL